MTCDILKETVSNAYNARSVSEMRSIFQDVINTCKLLKNKHFEWFGRLIKNNLEEIVAYAANHITSGKCEGIVNLIKTIRRASYGIADIDYFFLRLIDATNRNIIRGVS